MVMTVLIVDDELLARTRLRTLLGDCTSPATRVEAEAANAAHALAWLQHHTVDVALIDINMPGSDGLTLVTSLRALPNPPAILFVTAHAQHALQAFELDAVDYLTKPVRLERLQVALQKVERLFQSPRTLEPDFVEDFLLIQERGRAVRVPVSEVLYFKAELKYVTVRTAARAYLLEMSLNELEEKYKDRFMRIHRNALIARRAVRALEKHHDADEGEGWAVRLDGIEELLFVSRRQLTAVREMVTGAA
jgi:two-component system response regulator AlgR